MLCCKQTNPDLKLQLFRRLNRLKTNTDRRILVIQNSQHKKKIKARIARTVSALKKCSTAKDLQTGRRIHADLIHSGDITHIHVANTLLDMYCKCGRLVEARKIFDEIPQRTVVSWTSMLLGYVEDGQAEIGLFMFSRMQDEGFVADRASFLAALKACSGIAARSGDKLGKIQCLEKGREIHAEIRKNRLELNDSVASSLVDMYSKCGSLAEARSVFDGIQDQQRDLVSWTGMIQGFAESGDGESALKLYRRMTEQGCCVPNRVTYLAALKACGDLAALEAGRTIESEIFRARLQHDPLVAAALVDFYGKCGCVDDAREIFESFATKDLVTWNALLSGYGWRGDCKSVLKLFDRMLRERLRPDGVIFLSILQACSQAGLVDKGLEFFERMSAEFSVVPGIKHYTCVVDLLGRANRLDEAVWIVKQMPCEADLRIWMVVLGACQKWRNVELGKVAFDSVVKLDKNHAAAYVVMANICSGGSELLLPLTDRSGQSYWTDLSESVHSFSTQTGEYFCKRAEVVCSTNDLAARDFQSLSCQHCGTVC